MTSTGVAFGSMAGVRTTIKTAQATPVAHATPRVDPRDSRSQAHPRLCRRPGLRLAAWRTVWGAQRANPVYAARYRHLTTREHNTLRPTQAQTVIAAAILRHLHAVITTSQTW